MMDVIFKEYGEVRSQLRAKFQKQGMTEEQIDIKMNTINHEFFLHLWVNGANFSKGTPEERMKFYLDFLKIEIKEE